MRHPALGSAGDNASGAVQFFAQHKQRPFFLQLHYDAPHWPHLPPPEYSASDGPGRCRFCGNLPGERPKFPAL